MTFRQAIGRNRKHFWLGAAVVAVMAVVLWLVLWASGQNFFSASLRFVSGTIETFKEYEPITEQALLDFAQTPVDLERSLEGFVVLGRLDGVDVVVDHHCEDVCPAATIRIIRYYLSEGKSCEAAGGVEKSIFIGGWSGDKTFCFPRILAENWNEYRRDNVR